MAEPNENTPASAKSKAAEKQLLHQARILLSVDREAFNRVVAQLADQMMPEAKQHLSRSLRSPKNAIGIFRDHPLWCEITEAVERNRQTDDDEAGTE